VKRRKLVLYHPRADFYTLPLALLAIASALDRKRYQVLRAMGGDFQVAFFYYRPYTGTETTDALAKEGHPLPRRLVEWAEIENVAASPWVDSEKRALIERFRFYQPVAWARPTPARAPLQPLARWRCRRDSYTIPIEKTVVEWLRPLAPQG
jgi:hypothetical protein